MFHAGIVYKIEQDDSGNRNIFFMVVQKNFDNSESEIPAHRIGFPGGKSEAGETPKETLAREFEREEVGLCVESFEVVYVAGEFWHMKMFSIVTQMSGPIRTVGYDLNTTAPYFVEMEKLKTTIHPLHRPALMAAIKQISRFDGEFRDIASRIREEKRIDVQCV